jgi:hypothetical protein
MSMILNQKPVEFYPYKTVTILFDANQNLWKVVGIRNVKPNITIYEGEDEELANKFFNMILENDK